MRIYRKDNSKKKKYEEKKCFWKQMKEWENKKKDAKSSQNQVNNVRLQRNDAAYRVVARDTIVCFEEELGFYHNPRLNKLATGKATHHSIANNHRTDLRHKTNKKGKKCWPFKQNVDRWG